MVATKGIKNALPFVSGAALRTWLRDRGLKHDADDRYADGNDVGNGLGVAARRHFSCSWDCGPYQVSPLLSVVMKAPRVLRLRSPERRRVQPLSVDNAVAEEAHVRAPPAWPEQDDLVSLGTATLHAGRADRHARDDKPRHVRIFGKKAFERGGWNMSFDDVA